MLKMNIISKVEFEPISQKVIEEMIREQVKAQDPRVHVNDITFIQRRDPVRIEAIIDAQLGESVVEENVPEVPEVMPTFDPTPEPKEVIEPVKEEEPVKSVADIFNMES
jgi:hypothetical protein